MFENRVLKRMFAPTGNEVTEGWKILHNKKLHDLCSLPNIIRMGKPRRIGWEKHVARKESIKYVQHFGWKA
jgi:hypothetical protein